MSIPPSTPTPQTSDPTPQTGTNPHAGLHPQPGVAPTFLHATPEQQIPLAYRAHIYAPVDSHLNTLAICHYVMGGLTILFGSCPLIHVVMGIMLVSGGFSGGPSQPQPPAPIGYLFILFGGGAILFAWTVGILTIIAGRRLHQRRSRVFCIVVAALQCLLFPIGTVLGVFSLIVLNGQEARARFDAPAAH